MFNPITIPYGCKMLFNTVKLKDGVSFEDVELALGDMCNVVKNTYGNETGGFIAGQVFKYDGFMSAEGSFNVTRQLDYDVVILTYWNSYEQHEVSHADSAFKQKFSVLEQLCERTEELGFSMLWQGDPEKGE